MNIASHYDETVDIYSREESRDSRGRTAEYVKQRSFNMFIDSNAGRTRGNKESEKYDKEVTHIGFASASEDIERGHILVHQDTGREFFVINSVEPAFKGNHQELMLYEEQEETIANA